MRLKTTRWQMVFMILFLTFTLAGCSDKTPESMPEAAKVDPEALGPAESLETAISEADNIMEGRTSGPMLPVYFDFDSAMIDSDQTGRIEGNGDYIKSNSTLRVRIEGNCDSRGTSEYNLAWGNGGPRVRKNILSISALIRPGCLLSAGVRKNCCCLVMMNCPGPRTGGMIL